MAEPILLIGAGGFVGRSLLDAFARQGEFLVAVSRSAFDTGRGRVEAHVGALREVADFAPLLAGVRAVLHVASASTPGSSAGKPVQELDENVRPTIALLEALQARPELPLIYLSSGGTLYNRAGDGASDEGAAVYSRSYHGAGKIAAEHFIEAWCNQFGGRAIVLRPSNLYGPGQEERPGFGIVPTAFGTVVRNEVLRVWGDGSAERDYLYIDDFTRLVLAALDAAPHEGFQVFNACSGDSIDLNGLFALIEQVTGRALRRTYDAGRAVDAPSVRMQAIRARETFGWAAEVALREGLERTWRWFSTCRR
ncbi:MAG TPA: NAD-dependent epimerase/dehydratase family protein [Rhodanobacteraceae bacterium]|nr:NAD-dependent epimerase/dehydratase family protein [Rhodanobacteraceae bacterium]